MKVYAEGNRFLNQDGKEILFQGINFVCKEKEKGYIFPEYERVFKEFAEKGFNVIRLGIFWDGVEPCPGKYNDEYLKKVSEVVSEAKKSGLYVILDMHQDLWSVKYGDGAPEWATITDGAFHPTDCTMWFDAYLRSDAIINAAEHFWNNDKAQDGIGLMCHYISMWEYIVRFMDCHDNIIGYEPMNEPFMGSLARNTFGFAAMKTKEKYPEFDFATMQGITPESQGYMSEIVNEAFMKWDKETLMSFYQKVEDAIRPLTDKALIVGGNIYSSATFSTGITRVSGQEGKTWQIYSPHGYDSVVDSDNYENFNQENVIRLFAEKRESQLRLKMPVIVGEWGAFPSKSFTNDLIEQMNLILEKYLWSSTYWQYLPGMEKDQNYDALRRGYPVETKGRLIKYHYNRQKKMLEVSWDGTDLLCYLPYKNVHVVLNDEMYYKITKEFANASYVLIRAKEDGKHHICLSEHDGE